MVENPVGMQQGVCLGKTLVVFLLFFIGFGKGKTENTKCVNFEVPT